MAEVLFLCIKKLIPSQTSELYIFQVKSSVEYKTLLDQILKLDADCIALETCTEVKR